MLQPSIYGCELDNFPIFCRKLACVGQGARQLTGDEGSYLPKGKLLCLCRVANSLLSQELKLCFSDTKFTKAPYTKKDTSFF